MMMMIGLAHDFGCFGLRLIGSIAFGHVSRTDKPFSRPYLYQADD